MIHIHPSPKKAFKYVVKVDISSFWLRLRLRLNLWPAEVHETPFSPPWMWCLLSYTLTCYGIRQANYSSPCCEAMAKMLSGRYRSWWLWRHWTQKSGNGDVANLLSCECPALQPYLAITFQCICDMLNPTPSSSTSFSQSCMKTGRQWLHSSVLDPSTDFTVIRFIQLYGEAAIQF